jgi:ABC-2 type transport system ATP-binding protein
MSVIEITDLVKDFEIGFWRKRPVRAIDGLSLSVEQGEVFGFLGPNGAGKTTTLKILMGLLRPTSGSARILGMPVECVSMRRRIGYLPEHPYFYDYLTPAELLSYAGRLLGIPRAELGARVDALLERVGLAHVRRLQLRRFSKGMIQRIGIAQAILNNPEVVFLDEPMSGLDPLGRREVREVIASLRARGVTVFFSSHILPDVEALCDRVAILNRGKLQQAGALHDILQVEIAGHEIMLAHVSPAARERLTRISSSFLVLGDRLQLRAGNPAQLREILGQALTGGAELISLNPIRPSLEDHFFQEVAGQPGAAPAGAEAALESHRSHSG